MIEGVADDEAHDGGIPAIGVSPAKFPLNVIPEDGHTEESMTMDPFSFLPDEQPELSLPAELRGETQHPWIGWLGEVDTIGEMDPSLSAELAREDQPKTKIGEVEPSRDDQQLIEDMGEMEPSLSAELAGEDQQLIEEIGEMESTPCAELSGEEQHPKTEEIGEMESTPCAELSGEEQHPKTEEIGEMTPSLSAELSGEEQHPKTEEIESVVAENAPVVWESSAEYGLR